MINFDYRPEIDAGISYAQTTNSLQALLDKLRANSPKTVQQKLLEPGAQATPQGVFDYQRLMKRNTGVPPAYDGPGSIGPPSITGLSNMLDDLIELERNYPKEVLKSSWRNIRKPSKETLEKIRKSNSLLRKYHEATPHIEDIAKRLRKFRFSSRSGLIQFADPRPRNNLGQFQPAAEGGPDPNAMYRTYGPAAAQVQQHQKGLSKEIVGATLAAPLVGAGGTAGGLAIKELVKRLGQRRLRK